MKILISETEKEVSNYIKALSHFDDIQITCTNELPDHPEEFDALLIPGGGDIDPSLFGQEWNGTRDVDIRLDRVQITLCIAFGNMHKPILGICRGCQVINVAFGGDLIQDLPEPQNSRHTWHSSESGVTTGEDHLTHIKEGTFLADLYGTEVVTNSYHHQACGRIAKGFDVLQTSDDGVVEFIAHRALPIWGVQWHPEKACFETAREGIADGAKLFEYYVNAAKAKAEEEV